MFDLDHFKNINDTYGHTAGDAVLRQVAAIVSQIVPAGQLFARVGGEEFAILLSGIDAQGAYSLAEAIRRAVEGTAFVFDGQRIPVTVSLGVAERHPSDPAPQTLYERADGKLYEAKASGRNRVC
jgi:diguanylate cyclase (GGDEF)-like protein